MGETLSFIEGTEQGEKDSRDECKRFRSGFGRSITGREAVVKATRRLVTAEFKLTVLRAADA